MLPEVGSGGRTYQENLAFQQAYIGGFDASPSLHVTQDPNVCRPTFSLRGKALYRNSEKLLNLFADTIESADFTDVERIQEWLQQHATELQNDFAKNSLNYAIQTSLTSFSAPSFIFNQLHGLPYYQSVMNWSKDNSASFIQELQRM